ncbi:hypothetical protein DYB34_001868 [Aphanomyces astaci]|uniref:Tyrosine-protein kinase catalytic domain-containing protein n=1 Tax=Aphanomyces astaci TaxID=112090 RepID=A0A418BWA5_APHAT|nr:hypothetical protein DYB34_001868 [Aphanomyces astaci]
MFQGWPLSSMTSIASMSLTSISLERDRGKFTLVVRIPKAYPQASPDISCVMGGEVRTIGLPYVAALDRPAKYVKPLRSSYWFSQVVFVEPSVEHTVDLLMMGNDYHAERQVKQLSFQGSAKLATTNIGSPNPFDSSPHTSVPKANAQMLNPDSSGKRSTHDLLGMHQPTTPSHSNGRSATNDLLGFDMALTSSSHLPPPVVQRSNGHSTGTLAIQTSNGGNTSPQGGGSVQSPRGLELRYQSNECCIKCKFKDEARRFVFDKSMSFQQLQDAIMRLFQFPPTTVVTLAYLDRFTSQNADTVNKEFKHEVHMMTHLGCHPCIVLLLAVCSTPKSIVFEYLPFSLLNLLITDEGRVKLAGEEVIVSQSYSVSADIYSFGVVMWEICEASVPFADTPAALVAMAVIQENKRPAISPNIPTEATVRPDAATIVNDLTKFLQASQTPT